MATVSYNASPTTIAHNLSNFRALEAWFKVASADAGNLTTSAGIPGYLIGAGAIGPSQTANSAITAAKCKRRLITSRLLPDAGAKDANFDYTKCYVLRSPSAQRVRIWGAEDVTLASGSATGTIPIVYASDADVAPKETLTTPLRPMIQIQTATVPPPCTSAEVAFTVSTPTATGFTITWQTGGAAEALSSDWEITVVWHLIGTATN